MKNLNIPILGRDYEVACEDGQEDDLLRLSSEFDRRVKEISKYVTGANHNMLFLVASLQILDELEDAKKVCTPPNINDEIGKATISTLSQISERIESLANKVYNKA